MSDQRENWLPLPQRDVVELCALDPRLPETDRRGFRDLCQILASVFHFEFHKVLTELKANHRPFDPDAETAPLRELTSSELETRRTGLVGGLEELLRAANYDQVQQSTLAASLEGESLFKVRLAVDFDDFEELLLYRRGRGERRETVRSLAGLRNRDITFLNFSRVVLYVRFKPHSYFAGQDRKNLPFGPGTTILKLFRNVPAADLEMVFPNTAVKMKTLDKLLIGVPAAVGGVIVIATKLFGTILLIGALIAFWLGLRDEPVELDQGALVALAIGLGTLGAFVWKQVNRFKTRKIRFLKALTENLYFKNLDNNAGVLHRLVDEAEEEECKEAILAYWFLATADQPIDAATLDRGIEQWLRDRTKLEIDFEVHDAMQKLERLGLITRDGEQLSALPLPQAKARLDQAWDDYFDYANA